MKRVSYKLIKYAIKLLGMKVNFSLNLKCNDFRDFHIWVEHYYIRKPCCALI